MSGSDTEVSAGAGGALPEGGDFEDLSLSPPLTPSDSYKRESPCEGEETSEGESDSYEPFVHEPLVPLVDPQPEVVEVLDSHPHPSQAQMLYD